MTYERAMHFRKPGGKKLADSGEQRRQTLGLLDPGYQR